MVYSYLKNIKFWCTFFLVFSSLLLFSSNNEKFISDSIYAKKVYDNGIEYFRKGNYQTALDTLLKCLELRKQLYGNGSTKLNSTYNAIGLQYKNLGRLNDAINTYTTAIEIYQSKYKSANAGLGTIYGNLGSVYRQKGNFADALRYNEEALTNLKERPRRYAYLIEQAKYNIAEILKLTGKFEASLNIANENIKDATRNLMWKYPHLIGNIYQELGNYKMAKEYYLKSNQSLIDLYGESDFELGYNYVSFAQFLILMEDFGLAKEYLEKAKPIIIETFGEKGIDPAELHTTQGDLCAVKTFDSNSLESFRAQKGKNLELALGHYQNALIALCDNFIIHDPRVNPDMDQCTFEAQCLKVLQKKASTYHQLAELSVTNKTQQLDHLVNSLNTTTLASDLLNIVRTEIINEESKILLSELQNTTFLNTIEIAHALYKLTGELKYFNVAFENAERNKAASLMDNLTDQSARQVSLIPDSLLLKEENINLQIAHINEEMFNEIQYNGNDSATVEGFRSQLFLLEREKAGLTRYMETNYEEYFQMKYANDKIGVGDVQEKLKKNEVILEYVFDTKLEGETGNSLYLFVISKQEHELFKFNIAGKDLGDIKKLHEFLADPNYISITNEKFNNYLSSAYNLYNLLIRPVEDLIADRSVTVVPDGILSYVPFDALLYENVKGLRINFRNLPYLIQRHSFNYAYSTNLYINSFKKKTASEKLLAFAPSYKSGIKTSDEEFNNLAPLSGVIEEVNNISGQINTLSFLNNEATEQNFLETYKDFDILHLSMHTLLNDSLPMFSKLAFMPSQDKGSETDGWLTTQEIYNLKLNSRLAVLSACNTGSGVLRKGEGVISLARGFIYAGCPSIIMTLWEVEDRSGASILEEFYDLLGSGKKKHEALRLAKLKHISEADPLKAHPHYWLGYVSIGNTDPMFTSNDFYFFAGILLILLAVLADQLYRNKKARKNRAF